MFFTPTYPMEKHNQYSLKKIRYWLPDFDKNDLSEVEKKFDPYYVVDYRKPIKNQKGENYLRGISDLENILRENKTVYLPKKRVLIRNLTEEEKKTKTRPNSDLIFMKQSLFYDYEKEVFIDFYRKFVIEPFYDVPLNSDYDINFRDFGTKLRNIKLKNNKVIAKGFNYGYKSYFKKGETVYELANIHTTKVKKVKNDYTTTQNGNRITFARDAKVAQHGLYKVLEDDNLEKFYSMYYDGAIDDAKFLDIFNMWVLTRAYAKVSDKAGWTDDLNHFLDKRAIAVKYSEYAFGIQFVSAITDPAFMASGMFIGKTFSILANAKKLQGNIKFLSSSKNKIFKKHLNEELYGATVAAIHGGATFALYETLSLKLKNEDFNKDLFYKNLIHSFMIGAFLASSIFVGVSKYSKYANAKQKKITENFIDHFSQLCAKEQASVYKTILNNLSKNGLEINPVLMSKLENLVQKGVSQKKVSKIMSNVLKPHMNAKNLKILSNVLSDATKNMSRTTHLAPRIKE
jgi:ribosomal protein L18E